jgi:hypothetical protein
MVGLEVAALRASVCRTLSSDVDGACSRRVERLPVWYGYGCEVFVAGVLARQATCSASQAILAMSFLPYARLSTVLPDCSRLCMEGKRREHGK